MSNITREEAIAMLKSKMDGSVDTSYEWVETVRMAIEALKASPKKGKWIPVTRVYTTTENDFPYMRYKYIDATEPDEIDAVRCSECSEVFDFYDARNWCTQCGANMRGEE